MLLIWTDPFFLYQKSAILDVYKSCVLSACHSKERFCLRIFIYKLVTDTEKTSSAI